MSSHTPNPPPTQRNRSNSRSRAQTPPPRPTTPLRPPSRNSLRSSYTPTHGEPSASENPLASLEAPFGELSDSMADLEANFVHLQLMHESLARFSECFASFLYGLNVNAFCVDFPEGPVPESFRRASEDPRFAQPSSALDSSNAFARPDATDSSLDPDQTFLTTDTSFVENPPASSARTPTPRFNTPGRRGAPGASSTTAGSRGARGGAAARGSQGAGGARGSGLARATARGRLGVGR